MLLLRCRNVSLSLHTTIVTWGLLAALVTPLWLSLISVTGASPAASTQSHYRHLRPGKTSSSSFGRVNVGNSFAPRRIRSTLQAITLADKHSCTYSPGQAFQRGYRRSSARTPRSQCHFETLDRRQRFYVVHNPAGNEALRSTKSWAIGELGGRRDIH